MYGRSAGGIKIEPSACWYCSKIATIVRPTASPEPLRVWANSAFAPWPRRKRMEARRAWKSPKFEQDEISRYAFWPGSQTSRSYVLAAPNPMSPVHKVMTR